MVCKERTQILEGFMKLALANYLAKNKNLPSTIVVYRDGVGGPTMMQKVLDQELETMCQAMATYQAGYKPKLLYTFVDKRINTRFAER